MDQVTVKLEINKLINGRFIQIVQKKIVKKFNQINFNGSLKFNLVSGKIIYNRQEIQYIIQR